MSKKIISIALGSAIALSLVFGGAVEANALTTAELQAQIAALQAQLTALTGETSTTGGVSYTFTQTLKQGSTGVEVLNLQKLLNQSADTQVSLTGAGSPGNETSYFGPATKGAVIKFQEKYASDVLTPLGLSSGTGLVGAATRAKLNSMTVATGGTTGGTTTYPAGCTSAVGYSPTTGLPCSGGTTTGGTVTPTVGTGLTVSAPQQPAVSLAPESASRVPFTKVTLSAGNDGDVTVNSITVERTGLAQDAVFSGVVLLDENGLQIGIAKTWNSNHQAMVGEAFTVKAGQSRTLTIAGNMAASLDAYAGQVATIAVVGVNTSATVSGTLPITGTAQTINASLTLGSATLATSSYDPATAITKEIGTTGYKFSGIRATAGSAEKIRLWSIRWNQIGSASSNDLANVKTYVDGTAYDTTISADGKYYTSIFPGGILIDKGFSKDIYVQADIIGTGSANRTVQFDIYKTTDIYLTGETYGYGVSPTANTTATAGAGTQFTTGTPFFDGSLVTISAGSVTTVSKATSVAAQNIAINVANQPLGGFDIDLKGEPVSVQQMIFHIATTGAPTGSASPLLTNVTLVDSNGAVVAGPVDATAESATLQKVTFTDTVTFPIGKKTYTLKGKVASVSPNGGTFIVSTTPSTAVDWTTITGQTTGNSIPLALSAVTMNTMTVKAASLAITVSSNPVAQTIVSGAQSFLFSNIQLDATQSGEDMRISNLPVKITVGSSADYNDLTACQIYDGSTALNTGSNVVNPTASTASPAGTGAETFTFDQSLTIPKGTVKTLAIKCNVSSGTVAGANETYKIGMTDANITGLTVTGITSSASVTPTGTGASQLGQLMTVGSSSLTVTKDASSPSYTVVSGGSTGVVVGVIKFTANNQAVNLQKVGLKLTNTASSSSSDLVRVTLWDGATQVGTAVTFTGANTIASSTDLGLVLPKDSDKTLIVKADLAGIGTSESGTQGHLIAVDYQSAQGTGSQSGTTIEGSGSTAFDGIRLFKSFPTFAGAGASGSDTYLSTSGVAGTNVGLLRFKVTADAAGDVAIASLKISIATTSATVMGVNIYGFTDSAYSQGISGINTSGAFLTNTLGPTTGLANAPTLQIVPQTTTGASTTITIPKGTSRYFEVRGNVAVVGSATSYSVSTTLKGDTAYPAAPPLLIACNNGDRCGVAGGVAGVSSSTASEFMASSTAFTVTAATASNFIWSPLATTTSLTTNDWTNGYGIMGLPSNGITHTRNQ